MPPRACHLLPGESYHCPTPAANGKSARKLPTSPDNPLGSLALEVLREQIDTARLRQCRRRPAKFGGVVAAEKKVAGPVAQSHLHAGNRRGAQRRVETLAHDLH